MARAISRRNLLVGAGALAAVGPAAAEGFDAVVAAAGTSHAGTYPSVAAAVAAAPAKAERPFRILVSKGRWRERVIVDKPAVHLIGEGRDESTIVFDTHKGDPGMDGKPLLTIGTATMAIHAADFRASRITIANDFDYVANMPKPIPNDATGPGGAQAVALLLGEGADRSLLEDVRITSYQDTCFTDAGRSLFRKCRIEGCVDFIFGAGRTVFQDCEILSRLRPGHAFQGYIAAPDTNRAQPFGLVFLHCRLLKEGGVPPNSVALGRPWRHGRAFTDGFYGDPDAVGECVYLQCWMDDHIIPEGWYPMPFDVKGGGPRAMMQPEEARLFEYESHGPGAGRLSSRRRQLTASQAATFTVANVLQGWTGP